MGALTIHGLPGTIPSATRAVAASILGSLTLEASLRLPEPARAFPARISFVAA